ncbi:MAG: hypothetical protein BAJALOKI3v1_20101 [Promethearchaeota archaeon]|nr:MAG: hypothetical protein BAJALOKI3v1_20101 [Candidatus Lokiarchaeota archaeon]
MVNGLIKAPIILKSYPGLDFWKLYSLLAKIYLNVIIHIIGGVGLCMLL